MRVRWITDVNLKYNIGNELLTFHSTPGKIFKVHKIIYDNEGCHGAVDGFCDLYLDIGIVLQGVNSQLFEIFDHDDSKIEYKNIEENIIEEKINDTGAWETIKEDTKETNE